MLKNGIFQVFSLYWIRCLLRNIVDRCKFNSVWASHAMALTSACVSESTTVGRALALQAERQEASTQGCMVKGVVGQMASVRTPAPKLSIWPGALRLARPALQLAPVQNLMNHIRTAEPNRYSASMRWLNWLRPGVVLGTLAIG